MLAELGPNFAKFGPESAGVWRISPKFGPDLANGSMSTPATRHPLGRPALSSRHSANIAHISTEGRAARGGRNNSENSTVTPSERCCAVFDGFAGREEDRQGEVKRPRQERPRPHGPIC